MSFGILRSLLLAAAAIATAQPAAAQTFPDKPVRLIVPLGAGGSVDVVARLVAEEMAKTLAQAVIVENRPGGSGMVAAVLVKNAPADGYTLFAGATNSVSPVFVKDKPLLATREFAPVSGLVLGDWFLYVPASLGVNSLKELSAYAKANPGRFKYASLSAAGGLIMAMLARRMGFPYENIPYKTSDQSVLAITTGDVQSTFNSVPGFLPYVQSGKLKVIAALSPQRTAVMPDVPTALEQGVSVKLQFLNGLWAPLATPPDRIARLNASAVAALKTPAVVEPIQKAALTPTPTTPEQLLRLADDEIRFFSEAAEIAGYKPE